jgi:single-strand DNA-binding protein
MSDGFNLVTLFGNLGAEPELKLHEKGPVLTMRLATSYTVVSKDDNTKEEKTEWHNLTMFGTRAEALARHLHKGSKILVRGHLKTTSWEKDGQKRYRTEVVVDDLCFGGARPNGAIAPLPRRTDLASADLPF